MGWPKGKPRKGYIKKDGTPHAPKRKKVSRVEVSRSDVAVDTKPPVSGQDEVATDVSRMRASSAYEGEIHGVKGTSPITAVCPKCGYAYADGGYCSDCGWMQAINILPMGAAGSGKIGRA